MRTILLLALIPAATLRAQGVLGVGSDATIPDRGTVRVSTSARFEEFSRRFSRLGNGSLEPLGADFTLDTLGVRELPHFSSAQARIRTLTDDPAFTLSFGRVQTNLSARVERIPIGLEVGLLRRLAVFATIPIVRTRATPVIGTALGSGATVGLNPALTSSTAFNRDTTLVNAFIRASGALTAKLAQCEGSSSPDCAAVNSDRAGAQALATTAQTFATNLRGVYVESRAVPVVGGSAQAAVESRIAAFKTQFTSFGIGELGGAPAGPTPAPPLAFIDFQRLLTDTAFSINAHPLVRTQRTAIGDVELGAKAVLIDAMPAATIARPSLVGLRLAVGGLVRMGTGKTDVPENFIDIGTGDGQTDFEGQAFLD
jgi:hypothetical protein